MRHDSAARRVETSCGQSTINNGLPRIVSNRYADDMSNKIHPHTGSNHYAVSDGLTVDRIAPKTGVRMQDESIDIRIPVLFAMRGLQHMLAGHIEHRSSNQYADSW
jgi:hypothetical protein